MRDRLILQKIVLYCQRIADDLDRYRHDFSAFEQSGCLLYVRRSNR